MRSVIKRKRLCLFQTIVRGSMIGHGDYIAAMISDMNRLSVTSSNSLRKSSPSARKRAQSLGRLGEVNEGETYQYEGLTQDNEDDEDADKDQWRERARNIHSETNTPYLGMKKSITLQPNGILPKAKSTYEVSTMEGPPYPAQSHNMPVPSYEAYMNSEVGSPQERVIWKRDFQLSRGMQPNQRPIACFYSPAMSVQQPHGDQGTVTTELRPNLPMYMHPQNSPGRPFSSYDLKVGLTSPQQLNAYITCRIYNICYNHIFSTQHVFPLALNTLNAIFFVKKSSGIIFMLSLWKL